MPETAPSDVRQVPQLVRAHAPFPEIEACFAGFAFPSEPTPEEWAELVGAATAISGSSLAWMSPAERSTLFERPVEIVKDALTTFWPAKGITRSVMRTVLADFISWMEQQPDERVLQFTWDILSAQPRRRVAGAHAPLHWMRWSGRLSGAISYENIELAIALMQEAEAMYWWPAGRWGLVRWLRDSQPYLDALKHGSCLVRATGGRALGELMFGCSTHPTAESPPALAELMKLILERERKTPGIAGPFLQGAHWSTDPFLPSQPFDFRSWFLELLRLRAREPWVPRMQSLEYYAHEFFARDAAGIEEMLKMGREHLAVMTATAAPDAIPELMPILRKMSDSPNPRIAQAIQKYMVVRRRHAGLGTMES